MLLTASPKARIAQHSTGWRAMRIVTDRGGKFYVTGPADWIKAKHRALTLEEKFTLIHHRIRIIRSVHALRESRP